MLESVLLFILISPLYSILYKILGIILFKFNKTKKIGHYLVGMSIAGDFGNCRKIRKWLYVNCPYNYHCENCKIWTCKNTKNRNFFNDVKIVTIHEALNSEESQAERGQN